jgi:hypothetical protein
MTAQEASVEISNKSKKGKQSIKEEEPSSYESLLKQINACSMEE